MWNLDATTLRRLLAAYFHRRGARDPPAGVESRAAALLHRAEALPPRARELLEHRLALALWLYERIGERGPAPASSSAARQPLPEALDPGAGVFTVRCESCQRRFVAPVSAGGPGDEHVQRAREQGRALVLPVRCPRCAAEQACVFENPWRLEGERVEGLPLAGPRHGPTELTTWFEDHGWDRPRPPLRLARS
jgi:ribosomal protein S27E